MLKRFKNAVQQLLFISFIFVLQACGGSDNTPKYAISADTSAINLSNEIFQESTDSIKIEINFDGKGLLIGFAPDAQPANWLNYRITNLTTNSATVYIDVVNAQFLAPNNYQTTLRLSTGDPATTNLVHYDIDISLLVWQLDLSTELLSFADTFGVDSIESQTFDITSAANEWQLTSNVDWLTLDITEGSGNATITVTPDISQFSQAGLQNATITLTEKNSGDTKILPVELGLDNVYLFVDKPTLAFSLTQNTAALSAVVSVNSNNPKGFTWQAQSDADWLTLTPDETNNKLTVVVNSSALPSEEYTETTIVISPRPDPENPDVPSPVINEIIKVSFYQSDLVVKTEIINDIISNTNAMVADPLKPLIYVGVNNELRVYHQYSAQLLNTLVVAPEASLLEQFVIHPQGSMLIAQADETILDADGNETGIITHRYKINLADYSITEVNDASIEFDPVRYVRFAGRYFLVTQIVEFANDNLQQLFLDRENAFFARAIDFADQAQSLYVLDPTNISFKRYVAKVNDFTQNKITATMSHEYHPESLAEGDTLRDFVVTSDEKNIYTLSPTTEWVSFDGDNFTDHGLLENNTDIVTLALTLSHNNYAHFVRFDPTQGFLVNIYDQQQNLTNTILTAGNQPSNVTISADDKRLIVNTANAQALEIITLEQFELSSNKVDFSTVLGNTDIASQTITLTGISDNWQATTNTPWLILTEDHGTTPATLTLAIDTSNITTWGLLTGSVSVYDPISNTTNIITVTIAVDEVRLSSNYPALAFNSSPSKQVLTHTVDILTNRATAVAWQATTSANWLTLTSDNTNNRLTIIADDSLVSEGITYAEIDLSSTSAGAAISGKILLSINKNANDANTLTLDNINANQSAIVLDPLRPLVYIGQGDQILIYNIHSGALENTLNSPLLGVDLTNLVIYPDGSKLLASSSETVIDAQGNSSTLIHYYEIDLSNHLISEINNENITIEYRPIRIDMVAGKPIVVTQTLEYADTNLVRQYWDQANAYFAGQTAMPASKDGLLVMNNATNTLNQYQLSFNLFAEKTINLESSTSFASTNFTGGVSALAADARGSNIYSADSDNEWTVFDGTNYTEQGILYSGSNITSLNVVTDSANNSYFYRFDPSQGFVLTKYDSGQQLIYSQTLTTGTAESYLAPSYQRIVNYDENNSRLIILSIP